MHNDDARIHHEWVRERVNSRLARKSAFQEKVGLIGSSGPAGQAAQGVASSVIPGDLSGVRSPVRSRIYSSLTPGPPTGRNLRRLGRARPNEREWRCPEGYQFGGRFTDSKWSTCGRQLFDLPNLLPSLLDIARASIAKQPSGIGFDRPRVSPLSAGNVPGGPVIESRKLEIPRVGGMSKPARESGIKTAVMSLTENPSVKTMMIRRDGFPMQPVVTTGELRQVPDNRNMEEAAFILSTASVDEFGADELGLLSNTGVTSLIYVTPNGSTVRMDRTRPLSVGERRQLGKTVSSASSIDNSKNPLARLEAVVADSNGAIALKKDFGSIKNPDSPLESGKNAGKPRWVEEAFKGSKKPTGAKPDINLPDGEAPAPATAPVPGEPITNIENAIEHINNGGNLSDISPEILPEAIRRAKVYKQRRLGSGRTLFVRNDGGVSFVETQGAPEFEHLGAHLGSAVNEAVGLPSARVRLAGKGSSRPYLTQTPDTVLPDAKQVGGRDLSKMPPTDLAGILVSDFLTDVRDRNPATIIGLQSGDTTRAIASSNVPSALSGLSQDELKKRRSMTLDNYLTSDGKTIVESLTKQSEDLRKQALSSLQEIIKQARAFKWDDYVQQLKIDGRISSAEENHLKIVRSIYENRLEQLSNSQEMLASALKVRNA